MAHKVSGSPVARRPNERDQGMQKKVQPTAEQVEKWTVDRLKKFTEHLESGKPITEEYSCRKIILDVEIEPYSPEAIKKIRGSLRLSQAVFAKFLNVSLSTVTKWEQGIQPPTGAACRLLDEIHEDPEYWKRRFASMTKSVKSPATVPVT
jgi:putative transcriptional regulator